MSLPLIVDNFSSVPEPLREHYVASEGRYRLNVDGLDTLTKQWDARIASLTAERDAAIAAECAALTDAALDAAVARAGANATGRALIPQFLKGRVRIESDGSTRRVAFFQADEKTPMLGTGTNGAATWDDLMSEVRVTFASLFRE